MDPAEMPTRRSPYLLGALVIPPRLATERSPNGIPPVETTAPRAVQPTHVAPVQGIKPQPSTAPKLPAKIPPRGAGAGQSPHEVDALNHHIAVLHRKRRRLATTAWIIAVVCAFVTGILTGVFASERGLLGIAPPARASLATAQPAVTTGDIASVANAVLQSTVYIAADAADGTSTGSGWVYDTDGTIVTNTHVVVEKGELLDNIVVVSADGTHYDASVRGYSREYDLAVLQIDAETLPQLTLADSSQLHVGQQVIAVGAPLGLQGTVTTGIISALNRPVESGELGDASFLNAIQTDAAINPGNSGGPLVDMSGRIIGVNSAVAQPIGAERSTIGSIGLGFAIPAAQVKRTVDEILQQGYATYPAIGVQVDTRDEGAGALIVTNDPGAVIPGGPAAAAGLQPGDRIVAVNDIPMHDVTHFIVYMRSLTPGETVELQVKRGDDTFRATCTLESKRAD
ncbi:MAG: trypsin-like peptidase domain-containing protein [Bowdeniella nasicola]|nr:trypsin-like peptidase domain-containing protein [Bowdeniella nasicola]